MQGDDGVREHFKKLNEQQYAAVSMPHESCLVLAGAGSGKTSVLTSRIAALMAETPLEKNSSYGLKPGNIMAVTFTNKAAKEMKERLKIICGDKVNDLWIGTFHSICLRMLRKDYVAAGVDRNFTVLDPDGQEALIRQAIRAVKEKYPGIEIDKKLTPASLVSEINSKKETGRWDYESKPGVLFNVSTSGVMGEIPKIKSDAMKVELISMYNQQCRQQGYLDFNDLLILTNRMLRNNVGVRNFYRQKFSSILVDEFQDINDVQYEWLKYIAGESCAVMAVGDDDQSIYSFRGAHPENMQLFIREFVRGKKENIILLEQNYRSANHILMAANNLISKNSNRIGKNLWSTRDSGENRIDFVEYDTPEDEAAGIAEKVKKMIADGTPENEIAVLFRTNMQSRLLEHEFNKRNIRYLVYGGFQFYDRVEIKRMLDYIDLIGNPKHDVSFINALSWPPRGIGEKSIASLLSEARSEHKSIIDVIVSRSEKPEMANNAKQAKLEQFVSFLFDMIDQLPNKPLSEIAKDISELSGIMKMLNDENTLEAKERANHIKELISSIHYAEQEVMAETGSMPVAADFIYDYLAKVKLETSTSEADMGKKNTVSLMTIHASKGLEFGNVFIVGLEDGLLPIKRVSNDEEEERRLMEEERRLMYVAITRAKDRCEISRSLTKKMEYSKGYWCNEKVEESPFLKDIGDEFLRRKSDAVAAPCGEIVPPPPRLGDVFRRGLLWGNRSSAAASWRRL